MPATEYRQEEARVFTANTLIPLLEAYLFVAIEPVTPAEIAKTLGISAPEVEESLEDLVNLYARRERSGLHILRIAGGYQIATKPELAQDVGRLLAAPAGKARLSKPALETLAIVAYQQPVTTAEMEAVRGVSVDGVVKTLLDRRLIREDGRKAVPGRPILYATTPEFLHYFGLASLDDLPPLEDVAVAEAEQAEARDALQAVGIEE